VLARDIVQTCGQGEVLAEDGQGDMGGGDWDQTGEGGGDQGGDRNTGGGNLRVEGRSSNRQWRRFSVDLPCSSDKVTL